MKTQIITALSIAAVLGTAGGAYAVNQTMLASATNETSVIGTATPVLVPIAPKGADIPADYREQLANAANQKPTPAGGLVSSSTTSSPPAPSPSASSHDSDDDSEDSLEVEYEDEHEDETDDDD
ncbi:MAG: hypothetical protein C0444_09355 [Microbacterium sp.]|nr:hypothetical protein [Microbacterium sp.]MBA4344956.1 hypothetical protein [Microbacterium sp.]